MDNLIDPAAVLAGSPDGILVLDTDGTIRFVNAPAEDLLGQRADELVGRHLDCSTIPDDTFPLRIIRPDGNEVVMEVRVVAAPWLGEAASVLWLRDLTLRGSLTDQLRQAHVVAIIRALGNGIARRLNQMLTSIRSHSLALARQLPAESLSRRRATQIGRDAARANRLVRRVLQMGQNSQLRLQPVDHHAVLRDIVALLACLVRRPGRSGDAALPEWRGSSAARPDSFCDRARPRTRPRSPRPIGHARDQLP